MKWFFVASFLVLGLCLAEDKKKPNVIVIIADDMGFNDVGFHGSDEIPTPNIDALAYNGVILNSHYTQALCTPSRAAFLTGKYPIHLGMQHLVILEPEPWGLPLNETLMPQHFKNNGYKTHAVGKWHLGFFKKEYTPTYRGFDTHYGYWQGLQDYYKHTTHATFTPEEGYDMRRNMDVDWDAQGKYSTTLFTQEAVNLIREHDTQDPMFLYMAHLAPHTGNDNDPLQAPDEEIAKFAHIEDPERRIYAAMVSMLDQSVGTVIQALREKHMLENSIIVLFSDNGAQPQGIHANHGSNYPFRGAKNSAWEGGHRNLALVWSPMIKKTQRVSNNLMHLSDWLPTLFSAAGLNKTELGTLDGMDMWGAIAEADESPRSELVYNIDDEFHYGAVRQGDWKYTYGSTNKGKADKWFSDSGKRDYYHYDKNAILNSKVNSALTGVITYQQIQEKNARRTRSNEFTVNLIDENIIDRLRDAATIKCNRDIEQLEQYKCNLLETPCLFNIKEDPCETKNLVHERPNVARNLETLLVKYSRTALPPRNVPRDPNADPAKWNGTWTNWQDCENVIRQKLSFNALSPLAVGLISAATIAVIIIIVILLILNCRHKEKRSRCSSFMEDNMQSTMTTPLRSANNKDTMFEDRELQVRAKLREDIRTAA